jgi:hypothetical protein
MSMDMYVVLDVETKNLGSDIMKDNERLLSLQLGDATKQELYYYDSKDTQLNLEMGKKRIAFLLSHGVTFVGYNIKGFDTIMLKKFLEIEIPLSKTFELCDAPKMVELHGRVKDWSAECACQEYGVDFSHKQRMNMKAEKYRAREDIQKKAKDDKAQAKAREFVQNRGWTPDYAFSRVLDKIAYGHAIWDAYLEFVESGWRKDTLFYEYAIGDVISEYQLLKKLIY